MFDNLLSILVWLPIAGGVVLLAMVDGNDAASARANAMRWTALGVSVLTFILSIGLYTGFDTTTADMQFVERIPWIDAFRVEYFLGVDGFSMPLILLTTFLTPIVVLAGWEVIKVRAAQYFAAFLVLEGLDGQARRPHRGPRPLDDVGPRLDVLLGELESEARELLVAEGVAAAEATIERRILLNWRVEPRVLARFLEEAQVTAQLAHPSIPPVHEIGELSDGRPYFTMKEVHGETLAALIEGLEAGDYTLSVRHADRAMPFELELTLGRCRLALGDPAHGGHHLVAVKGPVAGAAVAHPPAGEAVLSFDAQLARLIELRTGIFTRKNVISLRRNAGRSLPACLADQF